MNVPAMEAHLCLNTQTEQNEMIQFDSNHVLFWATASIGKV